MAITYGVEIEDDADGVLTLAIGVLTLALCRGYNGAP
jgi:hypothetical protein